MALLSYQVLALLLLISRNVPKIEIFIVLEKDTILNLSDTIVFLIQMYKR